MMPKKQVFSSSFLLLPFEGTYMNYQSSKIKSKKEVNKTVEIKVVFAFFSLMREGSGTGRTKNILSGPGSTILTTTLT
jgi:hypothetical protein